MIRRHVTQHGTTTRGDALDVLGHEDGLLRSLFAEWDATAPGQAGEDGVTAAWDHGTVGKLLLEHGVVRLAALDDVVAALRRAGHDELADHAAAHVDESRHLLARISELSKGVQPINMRFTPDFAPTVERLGELWKADLSSRPGADLGRIADALGAERASLHDARWVRRHAPTHPLQHPGRLSGGPAAARLRTIFDRIRGWPWAESDVADTKLAERYDREAG